MNSDQHWLDIAEKTRGASLDPTTQIGVVLLSDDCDWYIATTNNFPYQIENTPDRWERPLKYQYVQHAERAAIYAAAKGGWSTRNATLYLVGMGPPCVPCTECTKAIIDAGITKVVGRAYKPVTEKWPESLKFSVALLEEAGVVFEDITDYTSIA